MNFLYIFTNRCFVRRRYHYIDIVTDLHINKVYSTKQIIKQT